MAAKAEGLVYIEHNGNALCGYIQHWATPNALIYKFICSDILNIVRATPNAIYYTHGNAQCGSNDDNGNAS
ncbi:MAG: hypothetical protein JST23_01925 [Bacteroidetes bacterium]|nr:hypothetical protein [Bacteroidota bacterium]